MIVSSYIAVWWLLLDDAEPLTSVESSTLVVIELGAAEPLIFRKSVRHLVDLSLLASVDSFGLDIDPGASNSVLYLISTGFDDKMDIILPFLVTDESSVAL